MYKRRYLKERKCFEKLVIEPRSTPKRIFDMSLP